MRHSLGPYRRDPEIPFFIAALAVSIVLLTAYLMYFEAHPDLASTLRYVAFHVVSISTSLGLSAYDYTLWPMFAQVWLLFLGSFIACSGSTAASRCSQI